MHTTRVPGGGEPDGQRETDVPRPDHRHVPRHAAHCSHGPPARMTSPSASRWSTPTTARSAVRTRAECHADRVADPPLGVRLRRDAGGHGLPAARPRQGLESRLVVPRLRRPRRPPASRTATRRERELAEEAGIVGAELEHAGTFLMELPDETEMTCVFRARYDGPLTVLPPEVIGLAAFPAGEVPEPLTPSARAGARLPPRGVGLPADSPAPCAGRTVARCASISSRWWSGSPRSAGRG